MRKTLVYTGTRARVRFIVEEARALGMRVKNADVTSIVALAYDDDGLLLHGGSAEKYESNTESLDEFLAAMAAEAEIARRESQAREVAAKAVPLVVQTFDGRRVMVSQMDHQHLSNFYWHSVIFGLRPATWALELAESRFGWLRPYIPHVKHTYELGELKRLGHLDPVKLASGRIIKYRIYRFPHKHKDYKVRADNSVIGHITVEPGGAASFLTT